MRAARRLRLLDGRRRRKRDAVLFALAAAPGPASGAAVVRGVPAGSGMARPRDGKPTHVYAYLRRLAEAGLAEADPVPGPRGAALWRATEAGLAVVSRFALRRAVTRDKSARERVVAAGMAAVLTERQLLVAAWYWFDGHTQRRIGDFLGCSRGAVCDRLRLIRYTLAAAGLPEPRRLERPPR